VLSQRGLSPHAIRLQGLPKIWDCIFKGFAGRARCCAGSVGPAESIRLKGKVGNGYAREFPKSETDSNCRPAATSAAPATGIR